MIGGICACFVCGNDLTQLKNISCSCYTNRLEKENRHLRALVKVYEDRLGITPIRNQARAKQILGSIKEKQQRRSDINKDTRKFLDRR